MAGHARLWTAEDMPTSRRMSYSERGRSAQGVECGRLWFGSVTTSLVRFGDNLGSEGDATEPAETGLGAGPAPSAAWGGPPAFGCGTAPPRGQGIRNGRGVVPRPFDLVRQTPVCDTGVRR